MQNRQRRCVSHFLHLHLRGSFDSTSRTCALPSSSSKPLAMAICTRCTACSRLNTWARDADSRSPSLILHAARCWWVPPPRLCFDRCWIWSCNLMVQAQEGCAVSPDTVHRTPG